MFSHHALRHIRPVATLLLTLGLTLALLWLLSKAISVAHALPGEPIPDSRAPAMPLAPNAILTVTNANDDGPGSLRQAIANADDGAVINFDTDYSIYLSSTLEITKQLTVDGGVYTVTVSGDTANDGTHNVRAFFITSTAVVTLSHLNIVSGSAAEGGGIYNASNLTLDHVTVMSNTASNNGGGIYNAGSLYAQDSLVHYNAASNSGCGLYNVGTAEFLSTPIEHNYEAMPIGGGIYNSGSLRIISSTVAYNSGMAYGNIWNNGGTLFLVRSTVSNGSSTAGGNAIANYNGGWAFLADSQIINNPGAIETMGSTVVITNSVIMSNSTSYYGGGINAVNSTVVITNSTVSGNVANSGRGGGLSIDSSTVELDNVTIANNTAAYYSGGASGGGLYIASGTVNAKNTIIAGNHDTGSDVHHPDCSGVLTSQGYNLIGDTTGCTISGTLTGVITNTAPLLGDLQDNGGATWTMALLPGSPAIDTGDDATCPPTDQRGVARPQGLHCDMGAYEYQSAPISYTLTMATAGNGGGVVTTNPIGPIYLSGTVVTLTATPLISSTFTVWSGDVIATTNPVTLTMDANKIITATFVLNTYIITPTAGANGSITPSTPQTVSYGASQTFTITPYTDYHIIDVGVDAVSQGAIVDYTFNNITASHTISAAFAVNIYTLTLNLAGNGLGSVISTPSGPSYAAGTMVTLTAIPSSTSRFTGWSGNVISTTTPLVATMDGNKAITATFVTHRVYLPLALK